MEASTPASLRGPSCHGQISPQNPAIIICITIIQTASSSWPSQSPTLHRHTQYYHRDEEDHQDHHYHNHHHNSERVVDTTAITTPTTTTTATTATKSSSHRHRATGTSPSHRHRRHRRRTALATKAWLPPAAATVHDQIEKARGALHSIHM